jgi:hypothetical protein
MIRSHLSDDRLIEVCVLEAPTPAEQQHLAACARCDARRSRLESMLDDVSVSAAEAADAAFPPERLTRQQARIMAHLQHEGRPARVIAFPAGHVHAPVVSRTRPASRWIAAAAVAGLVIGIIAGRVGHDVSLGRPGMARVIAARNVETPELRATGSTGRLREVSNPVSDEEFLSEMEIAIDSPAAALQPLDDLTPRAWDVR